MDSPVQHRTNPACPVIRRNPKEPRRELTLMRWGLIPSWAKDMSGAGKMINARSETAAANAALKRRSTHRRWRRRRRAAARRTAEGGCPHIAFVVPYNALEAGQFGFYTTGSSLGSEVAALP
jgi:hypothetical protein